MIALAAATLVVCAPGFPGSSSEARPAMEAFARSLAGAGHLPAGSLSAVYEESEAGGLRRLSQQDAALLLAPLPFFLEHERELRLVARLSAVPRGGEALERWTLVAAKDHPASLDGYKVQSSAGYSKRFVRAAAPGLPRQVEIQAGSAVLSALRRAADGEKIAVLLDGAQAAALGTLSLLLSADNRFGDGIPAQTTPAVPVPPALLPAGASYQGSFTVHLVKPGPPPVLLPTTPGPEPLVSPTIAGVASEPVCRP